MVILLKDGEEIRGVIEWYDRSSLKVHRDDAPNILLMKDTVKYMYKENEDKESDGDVGRIGQAPRQPGASRCAYGGHWGR